VGLLIAAGMPRKERMIGCVLATWSDVEAKLKILSGPRSGETITVFGSLLVGRAKECGLNLDREGVDSFHCLFILDERALKIRDLNTKCGTYVNGRRIAQRETLLLNNDDIVSVGSIRFQAQLNSGLPAQRRAVSERLPLESLKTHVIESETAKGNSADPAPPKVMPPNFPADQSNAIPFLEDDDRNSSVGTRAAETGLPAPANQLESARDARTAHVTLSVVAGPKTGVNFEFLNHSTFLVGRGPWAHLRLSEDSHFSRHHFRIEFHPPDCHLSDLGSRSGTFVNGNRVNSALLRDGDVISVSDTKIRVCVNGARVAPPTILGALSSTVNYRSKYLSGESNEPAPAQLIPGYELREVLGVGAMGIVYSAVHKSTGQKTAIKLISQDQTTMERAIQLFIREANLLGRLDHPNIVRCLDFGYTGGHLYLVMERVPTISLQDVLARETSSACIRIPCGIIRQVLQGLEHAHRMSIVHRDIKPENVLLCRDGRKLKAKLADFGLAKNYANAGLSEISHEGDLRGTLAYMPPELVVDCRNAGPAGDIYSVGATLYYYLCRQLPFDFSKRNKLAVVLEDDPVPLEQSVPEIPPKLAQIVHRAMAKEKSDRFASAAEMCDALEPFATRGRRGR
jgi:pSer/pThr/pTyr-binding forkhead associated (FHA) protein